MKRQQRSLRRYIIALFFLMSLMCVALPAWAAYQVRRPVDYEGGKVNQNYLYGEELPGYAAHHGLDFKARRDQVDITDIYAVAAGQVTDLEEDVPNGTGSGFGNYVLIRHAQRS